MKQISIHPNVIIAVKCNNTKYVVGKGAVSEFVPITYTMGKLECTTFPVQWVNAYGKDMLIAQSENISELATIRMGYHPELYEALCSTEVQVFRNEEVDPFVVHGSVDNIFMRNQILEFKVKRLVVKPNGD